MAYQTLSNLQMTVNALDPVRGWWDERQLSRVCPVLTADQGTVVAGMVGYLDQNNQFVKGSTASLTGLARNKMPLFARGGDNEMDAVRYEGNLASQRSVSNTQGTPAAVGNAKDVGISCLVGTGAYELGTTAFHGSITAGDLLMASITANQIGKLTVFTPSGTSAYAAGVISNNHQVVGIATSNGDVKNQHGRAMLYFYVNWWPAI